MRRWPALLLAGYLSLLQAQRHRTRGNRPVHVVHSSRSDASWARLWMLQLPPLAEVQHLYGILCTSGPAPQLDHRVLNIWHSHAPTGVKRGTHTLVNPTFQRSVEDTALLFEILLAGMQVEGEGGSMRIPDEELASVRSVEKLQVICEDVLPKKLTDVRRLAAELARRRQRLSWRDFERTVLTLVYGAQTLARARNQQQREAWTEAVVQLVRALQKDLTPM